MSPITPGSSRRAGGYSPVFRLGSLTRLPERAMSQKANSFGHGNEQACAGYLKENTRRNSSCSPAARRRFHARSAAVARVLDILVGRIKRLRSTPERELRGSGRVKDAATALVTWPHIPSPRVAVVRSRRSTEAAVSPAPAPGGTSPCRRDNAEYRRSRDNSGLQIRAAR